MRDNQTKKRGHAAHARAPKSSRAHDAARANDVTALNAALAADALALDAIDAHKRTPLHLAAYAGALECVELLCAQGARVAAEAVDGVTAFHFACMKGNTAVAKALVERGANAKGMTYKSENALHLAAPTGDLSLIAFLIRKKVNPCAVSKKGRSVLQCLKDDASAEVREAIEKAVRDVEESARRTADGVAAAATEDDGDGNDHVGDIGPSIRPSIGPAMPPSIGPAMPPSAGSIGPAARPQVGRVNKDAIGVVEDGVTSNDRDDTEDNAAELESTKGKKKRKIIGAMTFGEDDE